ncbi:MAG: tetratricopeptide repeat protein [Anaeromyxobacteraceae bacterium]
MAAYEEALRFVPGHPPSVRALDRLYAETGRTEELERLRNEALTDEDAPARGERLLRLARLRADRVGDLRGALGLVDALDEVLPGDPSVLLLRLRLAPEAAERARARGALAGAAASAEVAAALQAAAVPDLRDGARRRALEVAGRNAPASALLAPHAARALEAAGDHAARAVFCERLAGDAVDPAARSNLWLRAGEARDAAGQPERAFADLRAAVEAVPSNLPALRALRAHLVRSADWPAVRGSLHAEAAALRDPGLAAAAWLEAGALAEHRLGVRTAAADDYRHALERRPEDPVAKARLEAIEAGLSAEALAEAHAAKAREASDQAAKVEAWLAAARLGAAGPEERERALAAVGEVLALEPAHPEAHELKARLLAEADRPADAFAEVEVAAAAQADPARRAALHLRAAELATRAGLEPARALPHLEAAAELAPDDAVALERAARAHLQAGAEEEALGYLRRLAEVPTGDRLLQAERLAHLAEVEERRGRPDAALEALRRALDLDPGNTGAFRRLARFEAERGDPAAVAEALAEAARRAPAPGIAAEAHLEAARLLAGPLQAGPRAVEQLRAVLAVDPGRDEARALLAEQLQELSPGAAVEEHQALLARDPFRVESWQALCRLFERMRAHDRAYVCATVLRFLGAPSPGPAAAQLLEEGDRQALRPPPALSPDDWDLLRDPREPDTLAALLAVAGDALAEVLAPSPAERGPAARDDHPFRPVLEELCAALDAPAHALYPASRCVVRVEPGAPHAVLVGDGLGRGVPLREQRFLLGRAAARLRGRTGLLDALPGPVLLEGLAAVVALVVPGWKGAAAPPPELQRRVAKALRGKARKAIEAPARALAAERGEHDLAAFRVAAAATANRAGLVLCGDVPTALTLLLRDPGAPVDREGLVDEARRSDEARALLAFAAGEKHFLLRQRLRVAVA